MHLGQEGHFNIASNCHGTALQSYVFDISKDSIKIVRLLTWYAQYQLSEAAIRLEDDLELHAHNWANACIEAVNEVLRYDAMAYRLVEDSEDGYAVHKITSEAMVETAIQPALQLMRDRKMKEPLEEYEAALKHYARNETDDAVRQSSHAFESAMKFVLKDVKKSAPAHAKPSELIKAVSDAGILPSSMQNNWNNFAEVLQGVITLRNKAPGAGHGPGPGEVPPDIETAEYAINTAGSNILYLARRWLAVRNKIRRRTKTP